MSITEQTEKKMKQAVEHLQQELRGLRTNRASASMLDQVVAEVYGAPTPLRSLANIATPESRQILVTPFDPSTTSAIAKGIEKANLNLQPIVDGHAIRINIPPMNEETRKEIVKQAKEKSEKTKVVIRNVRKEGNDQARKAKADSVLTEDQLKKAEKTIQEQTDRFCKEVDDILALKEKEIMTV